MTDGSGGQVQVLLGDDTARVEMDSGGHKTLIVRGDNRPRAENPAPAAPGLKTGQTSQTATTRDKPYWEADPAEDTTPYYLAGPSQEPNKPYWQVDSSDDQRPYWLMEPERVEILASDMAPAAVAPAAPEPPLGAPAGPETRTITYFMYKDERGVKHVTNTPDDPRYRQFTAVVTIQRGLVGASSRFTHNTLRPLIMRYAAIYNLDPALIAAVIKSESSFDARAVSWAGAQGLMQLIPRTAREMGVANAFDPEQNIMGGSRYLRQMLNTFGGDLTLAIAAYNCGPQRVARGWRVPDIAETQNYVVIVLRNYEKYKLQF
jgi:hypothetical protein